MKLILILSLFGLAQSAMAAPAERIQVRKVCQKDFGTHVVITEQCRSLDIENRYFIATTTQQSNLSWPRNPKNFHMVTIKNNECAYTSFQNARFVTNDGSYLMNLNESGAIRLFRFLPGGESGERSTFSEFSASGSIKSVERLDCYN